MSAPETIIFRVDKYNRHSSYFFNHVCVCVWHNYMCALVKRSEAQDLSGTRGNSSFELSDVGAGD